MRGDGMDGLAIAIMIACVLLLLAPTALLGWVGLRWFGVPGGIAGAVLGLGIGTLAMLATFFESTWSPPPTITLEVPAGFQHEWVLIIPDSAATQSVVWSGVDAPFVSRRTRLVVPRSGIVRVKELGSLDGDDVQATLSNGKHQWGKAALQAPPNIGTGRLVAYGFAQYPGTEPDIGSMDLTQLAALIAQRDAEP